MNRQQWFVWILEVADFVIVYALAILLIIGVFLAAVIGVLLIPILIPVCWGSAKWLEKAQRNRSDWLCMDCCRFDRTQLFRLVYRGPEGTHACRRCGKLFSVKR